MPFSIFIEPLAFQDIQDAIDNYELKQPLLGKHFFDTVDLHIQGLKQNPFFQIRYDNVRCLPIKVFPYMIHFVVNQDTNTVEIKAVLNTHKNPNLWTVR